MKSTLFIPAQTLSTDMNLSLRLANAVFCTYFRGFFCLLIFPYWFLFTLLISNNYLFVVVCRVVWLKGVCLSLYDCLLVYNCDSLISVKGDV